jgi:hypothetical protein
MRVAVAGGTGLVGRYVVEELAAAGLEPVVLARSRGVDLVTGAGLEAAMAGVEAVVDVSNVTTMSGRKAPHAKGSRSACACCAGEHLYGPIEIRHDDHMSETVGETGDQLRIMRSELDELQEHAERQRRQQARYATVWYYADLLLGLPAVVLAAVSGAVGLASADGRIPAAFLAIASAASAAATRFLDCSGRGAYAARRRDAWRGSDSSIKPSRPAPLPTHGQASRLLPPRRTRSAMTTPGRRARDSVDSRYVSGRGRPPWLSAA